MTSQPTVLIDNEVTEVSETRSAPGATTGHHRHAHDYVIVPLTDGRLAMAAAEGDTVTELVTGRPYYRRAGVEHNVRNAGDREVVFIEVQFKSTSGD